MDQPLAGRNMVPDSLRKAGRFVAEAARLAVGRNTPQPQGGELHPAIFVLYKNGGIIGFEDARETSEHVPNDHLHQIEGAWNESGCHLQLSQGERAE